MPTPLDLIRQGILAGSWPEVCEGFALMTGQVIQPPKVVSGSNDTDFLKRLRDIIDRRLAGPVATQPEPDWKEYRRRHEPEAEEVWQEAEDEIEGQGDVSLPDPGNSDENDPDNDTPTDEPPGPANPVPNPSSGKPPPATAVEARARELRDASLRIREVPDFSIQHTGDEAADGDENKGIKCKTLPMDTSSGKNRFRDTRQLAATDIDESRRLSQGFAGKEARPQYRSVSLVCHKCDRKCDVHPDVVPRKCDPTDQRPVYVCDKCIAQHVK